MYVGPDRFRTMGLGVDLDDIEDVDLRSLLQRATDKVDAYCKVPMLPQRHDMRGGTITAEEHPYLLPRYFHEQVPRQIHLDHRPLRAVTQLRIYVTNTQVLEVQPSEVFVTRSLNRVEIVSLAMTSVGLFGAFIVPNIGLANPVSRTSYTYGWSFPVVDEVLETTDAKVLRSQHQWWDGTEDVAVKKNGTELTVDSDYTYDVDEGTVRLVANPAATDVFTASYIHRLPSEVEQATGIVAADLVARRQNVMRGMAGLRSLKVAEITMDKEQARMGTFQERRPRLPEEAEMLLDGFDYISIR
jgi:hypothetical protein